MNEEDHLIQPLEADPYKDELSAFWRGVGRDILRDSIKTIDEVGKQVITADGVLAGLYFNAIAFSDLRKAGVSSDARVIYLLPIIFLLASLVFAIFIFFPDRYKFDPRSSEGVRAVHRDAMHGKLTLLRWSMALLAVAVLSIGAAVWVYLG